MGRKTNRQRRAAQHETARERAAAARLAQRQRERRRRAMAILSAVVVAAVVVALIAVIAIVKVHNDKKGDRQSLPSSVLSQVTSVSDATLTTVGKGSPLNVPTKVSGHPPLTSGGKPELLYIGAEFCPYCAVERWSLAIALSKFGTLSNVSAVRSAVTDGDYASIDFYKSKYTSKYLTFTPVEAQDRSHKELEKLTSEQQTLWYALDGGASKAGFPTITFGNLLAFSGGAPLDPSVLGGMTQQQVASQLNDPKSKVAQTIDAGANDDIAAICAMTKDQPASACSSSLIQGLEKQFMTSA